MSKYVIDTTLDNVKKVIAMGVTKGGAIWTDTTDIENLEELNSDYISEHFGDLQDTAYQRGLNEAWEAARKLFSSMANSDIEKVFPTEWNNGGFHALINLQPQEVVAKLKAYEEKQDDKIGVGDVVKTYNGITFVVTKATTDGIVVGFEGEGNTCRFALSEVTYTGRHYNINEILGGLSDD